MNFNCFSCGTPGTLHLTEMSGVHFHCLKCKALWGESKKPTWPPGTERTCPYFIMSECVEELENELDMKGEVR